MSKYIDAEKLIAEIERMRKINREAFMAEHIKSEVFHGRAQAINHLFEFITSLQQEQPEVDLEQTIHEKVVKLHIAPCYDELRDFALYFYELGRKAKEDK